MNDSELLLWIAEHIVKFELGFGDAKMEYIDDNGVTRVAEFHSDELDPQDLVMLKGCIAAAVKEMETKR
jgi:hypothetical protein